MLDDVATPKRKRGRPRRGDTQVIDAQILAAAFAAFRSVGFDAAQMEAIAGDAGITKATLYRRFDNKASLLAAVIAGLAQDLAAMAKTVPKEGDPLDRLKGLMRLYQRRAVERDQIALQRLVISALPSQPSLAHALDALRESFVRPVDQLVEEAMAAGLIRGAPINLVREVVFNLLVNSATSLALMGLEAEVDLDAAFEFAWRVLIQGVGA
ncbi:MAG: TetR/AcrR family transcriptional regulator [Caulobacteraceae bacterium]